MNNPVLIFSGIREMLNVNEVVPFFESWRVPYVVIDPRHLFSELQASIFLDSSIPSSLVETNSGEVFNIFDVRSVWLRRHIEPQPAVTLPEWQRKVAKSESSGALWSLYSCLEVPWMNNPHFSRRLIEQNKLLQMKEAAKAGLLIPCTIITSSLEELRAFSDKCGGKILIKPIKGYMFEEPSGKHRLIYSNIVTSEQLSRRNVEKLFPPVMAQEYVSKQIELRITVVGSNIFACAIHSQDSDVSRVDWRRYDLANVRHEVFELPLEIQESIMDLMSTWKLLYGAFDLIITPGGLYYFLEVNNAGQWGWIENLTKMPISETIAHVLAYGH